MINTKSITKAEQSNDPKNRKDSVLYQKRMKSPAAPLQNIPNQQEQAVAPLQATIFNNQQHDFQQFSSNVESLSQRLQNRAAQQNEQTQLAVRAADGDALQALEAARYFRDLCVSTQNQFTQMQTQLVQQSNLYRQQQMKSKYYAEQLDSFKIEFEQDVPVLVAQINKIKQSTQECQLLATELGFPIPQQPEVLDVITPQCFDTEKEGFVQVDGQQKSLKQISLQLLLAEQQVLRNHNFLMKQMISDIQKQKAQKVEQQVAEQQEGEKPDQSQQIVLTQQYQNPVDIFQKEFNGSGIGVARELMNLRNKTASSLLREQRFDDNALLRREGSDNETLRAQVVGLQNELYNARELLRQLQVTGIGRSGQLEQKHGCYSGEQVVQMSNMALQEQDVDLLPEQLARLIDNLVLESLKAAEEVVRGRQMTREAQMPVSELQLLIERRDESTRKLDQVSKQLLDFLLKRGDEKDIEQELVQFLRSMGIEEPKYDENQDTIVRGERQTDALGFAQAAYEKQLEKNKQFQSMMDQFNEYMQNVIKSLDKENFEKYHKDGSGYAEVLDNMAQLLEHVRKLHVAVAQRDFAVVKLQKVVEQLSQESAEKGSEIANLVGVRNGLLKSYLNLRKQHELLVNQSGEIRRQATNCVQVLMDSAANSYDERLAEALKQSQTDYTKAVKQTAFLVKDDVVEFGKQLNEQIVAINAAVEGYVGIVNSKAQVSVQTDRQRKCYEQGVQVVIVEQVDEKGKQKGKK